MKITKEEKLAQIDIYVCDLCDFKSEYVFKVSSHEETHINKRNVGNTVAYFIKDEEQLKFAKNKLNGRWEQQELPNWFLCYDRDDNDYVYYKSIKNYIQQLEYDLDELKTKIEEFEKHKEEITTAFYK